LRQQGAHLVRFHSRPDARIIENVEDVLVVNVKKSHMHAIVEHGPWHRVGVIDRTQRLQQLFVSAVVKDEISGIRDDDRLRVDDTEIFVLAKTGQALRRERAPDQLRPLAAIDFVHGAGKITIVHQRGGHVGGGRIVDHSDIEVLDAPADIVDDRGELIASVGPGPVGHLDTYRHLELADSIHRAGDMQFGAKRGTKKAFADLGVGKRLALGGAPAADLVMLACRRHGHGGGKRECHDQAYLHGGAIAAAMRSIMATGIAARNRWPSGRCRADAI
jgi:hypothetical protein